MKNIVLIGMPACGKSTIGYWLSKKINFPVLDADKYLEEKENRLISDIFSKEGEEYFRELETKYLKELSEKEGLIISTGGGAVKKKENIDILKKIGYQEIEPRISLLACGDTGQGALADISTILKCIQEVAN